MCQELGVADENYFAGESPVYELDTTAPHMVRDNNKCILCRRCSAVCDKVQSVAVIGPNNRGFESHIASPFDMGLGETSCVSCGQCIVACPTGALYEKDFVDDVLAAIADPSKHVIVQPAPSVRAALGEEFGYPIGTDVEGKMAAALRRIGFDKVFDTDFAADLTIMEEAHEFLGRVQNGGVLPMITSCSPGWIKYCEHYYPDQLPHLSSCKSPQQMFGAIAKTYYAEKMGIDPKDIVCVSVMPCTAKKFEINRPDQNAAGVPDVDISLTTRELARLIRKVGIDFRSLPEEGFDRILGESTGAAVIFGATGGVMEAALRTAVEALTGEELESVEFQEVRGMEGIKEATYHIGDMDVKVAVASGLNNIKQIMDRIRSGEADYHFIEMMCCPGGCVNGGGQPIVHADVRNYTDVRGLRAKVLYDNDRAKTIRKSHENPEIKQAYDEYFGFPGSEKAHHILHTSYVKRKINAYSNS
jgi:NADP-reducing hydrogenase subunit HndD